MTTSINTMLKNRKNRKNKKGFSLVELIVVLVIMAILAAALVPTLIGYIRQSRQSNVKNEASACVQAAQTIVSSAFASGDNTYISVGTSKTITIDFSAAGGDISGTTNLKEEIQYLAEVQGVGTVSKVVIDTTSLTIKQLDYTNTASSITVHYNDGKYVVS